MPKHHHIRNLHSATHAGADELHGKGMPHAAHALRSIGATTGAVVKKVHVSEADISMMMHPVLTSGVGRSSPTRKRKSSGKRRKLTAKQIAAGFGGKRRRSTKTKRRSSSGRKKRRTPAQVRATNKMIRANKAKRGGGKRRTKRRAKR